MKVNRRLARWLSSPIAPACVALGVYLLFLAALGSNYSESAVLFLLPLVLAEAMARRWREAITLALAVVPYLVYQGVLWVWMGAGA